jgi:hypothetical protein
LKELSLLLGFHKKCLLDLNHFLSHFNHHKFWGEILGQAVVGKFQPRNMEIQNRTLRLLYRWVAMTLFPRDDVRIVHNDELRILFAMVKKIKISPIMPMIKQWLQNFKMSRSITCTSLVTRITSKIDALEDQNFVYISTPCLIIDEDCLVQGHTFKHDASGNLVVFFPGYTNEFPLQNPRLHLYNCRELTFTLVSQEEARRINVSSRMTRSRTRNEASSSQHQPPHSSAVM